MRLLSPLFLVVSAVFLAVGVLGLLANVIETEPYMVWAAFALCLAGMLGVILAIVTIAFPERKHKIAKMLLVIGVAVSWPWSISLVHAAFVLPEDSNGNRPADVVREFIGFCEAEDYAAAEKLYLGVPRPSICVRFKKIGLANCRILRGGRGKAGFSHVRVDFKEEGKKKHVLLLLQDRW